MILIVVCAVLLISTSGSNGLAADNPCLSRASMIINISAVSIMDLPLLQIFSDPESGRVLPGEELSFLCCGVVPASSGGWGGPDWIPKRDPSVFISSRRTVDATEFGGTELVIFYRYLRVNGSLNLNGTEIRCEIDDPGGRRTTTVPKVMIVLGPPASPIPTMQVTAHDTIRLSWGPVFAWQDDPITGYRIKTIDLDGSILNDQSTLPNETSVYLKSPEDLDLNDCAELMFSVSAINSRGESGPANISGGYPKYNALSNFNSTIESSVLFTSDLQPRVKFLLQLPSLCQYQVLNYTFVLEGLFNSSHQVLSINDQVDGNPSILVVSPEFKFTFRELYTVYATLYTDGRENTTMESVKFSTGIALCNKTENGVILYALGGLCAVLFTVLTLLLCGVCTCWIRKKGCLGNSKRTTPSGMVNNPIYDGPIYDSVYNERGRLISSAATTPTSDGIPEFPPVMAATNSIKLMENSLESQFGDPKQPLEPRYSSSAAATENAECYVKMKGKFASDVGDGLETVADKEQDVNLVRVTDV